MEFIKAGIWKKELEKKIWYKKNYSGYNFKYNETGVTITLGTSFSSEGEEEGGIRILTRDWNNYSWCKLYYRWGCWNININLGWKQLLRVQASVERGRGEEKNLFKPGMGTITPRASFSTTPEFRRIIPPGAGTGSNKHLQLTNIKTILPD